MTPAVRHLKKTGTRHVIHRYEHDPKCDSYGLEAAEKIGVEPERVYKTLVAELEGGELMVAVIPVSSMLDLKLLAKSAGVKKAAMAEKNKVEKTTGYIVGGVSPIAQKRKLRTILDTAALEHETIFISGGKRGLDIELSPRDLALLTSAEYSVIAR